MVEHRQPVTGSCAVQPSPSQKFGLFRIVDQVEKEMFARKQLVGKVGATVNIWGHSERGRIYHQQMVAYNFRRQSTVGKVSLSGRA